MILHVVFALLVGCAAVPFAHQHQNAHRDRSAHECPIRVRSANFIGDVKSDLPVGRDLGFVGKIQDTIIYTYGDTMSQREGEFYMTSDSSSIGTADPLFVLNTQRTQDGNHPTDMIPPHDHWNEKNTEDAFGGTNVIPTGGNGGMMFFLKNHRPGGKNQIIGAGIASVKLQDKKNITTERLAEYWWDSKKGEPWYGDIGAYSDGNYVYGYGHGGKDHMHVFLNRAPLLGWWKLENWEYWDGAASKWSKGRLYHPGEEKAIQWNAKQGAAWSVAQGQMVWSHYYKKIVWVYSTAFPCDDKGSHAIFARTADKPEGPWSHQTELYRVKGRKDGDFVYCAVANPYYDESGKSMVVTVNNGSMIVQAHRVEFE